jgi:hypothetical protein
MKKFVVIEQHYDITPGTVLTYISHTLPETNAHGCMHIIAEHPAGFKVSIPNSKVMSQGDTDVKES